VSDISDQRKYYERMMDEIAIEHRQQVDKLQSENAKLRELVCHLWYVKPRDVTSVLVEGRLVDLEELMEGVGLRWEDA
jgi:hypothetical protein